MSDANGMRRAFDGGSDVRLRPRTSGSGIVAGRRVRRDNRHSSMDLSELKFPAAEGRLLAVAADVFDGRDSIENFSTASTAHRPRPSVPSSTAGCVATTACAWPRSNWHRVATMPPRPSSSRPRPRWVWICAPATRHRTGDLLDRPAARRRHAHHAGKRRVHRAGRRRPCDRSERSRTHSGHARHALPRVRPAQALHADARRGTRAGRRRRAAALCAAACAPTWRSACC